jgi:hypothetical protein
VALDHFRAHGRRAVRLDASIRDASGVRASTVIDLGLGGACAELDEPLAAGQLVQIEILAPHLWDPLVIEARVVWVRVPGVRRRARLGLCFVHRAASVVHGLVDLLGTTAYE